MISLTAFIDSRGGFAHTRQLVAIGVHPKRLTAAVRSGVIIRVRRGWYSTLPLTDPRVQAVQVGGRLTGISAVIQAGGWSLGWFPLHVSVAANAARLRSKRSRRIPFTVAKPGGVWVHWDATTVTDRGGNSSVHLGDALVRVVLDEPFEVAVAALDWALRTGALDEFEFGALIAALPAGHRDIALWVDTKCDSLPESLSRTRLRLAGHTVTSQVQIAGTSPIDLVVDDCVGLEVDGEAFHRDRFEHDRDKDLTITIAGHHAIRPSARTVFHDWDRVLRAIETAIAVRNASSAPSNSGKEKAIRVKIPGMTAVRRRRRRLSPELLRGGTRE